MSRFTLTEGEELSFHDARALNNVVNDMFLQPNLHRIC